MTHQIGPTGRVTLEDKTFEVELMPHHFDTTYIKCEADCPDGWQILTYWLLRQMKKSPKTREEFRLLGDYEYVQNSDDISRLNEYGAGLVSGAYWVEVGYDGDFSYHDASLGVRYAREIPQNF